MKPVYLGGKETSQILGVHQRTLYQWDEKGWIDTIRTPGNKRLYNVKKFIAENGNKTETSKKELNKLDETNGKLKISYARVSSNTQKNDLERQMKLIKEKYPDHKMIIDIGSGINFNRTGIRKIIKLAIAGRIEELVIAYKDRLARFGYDLIEDLITEYSSGKIIIINKKDDLEPEEELMKDVLQVMNVFVAKMNGMRRYKNRAKNRGRKKIENKK